MAPKYKRILAFDIGGTGLKAAIVDEKGRFLTERLRVPTPHPCPPAQMVTLLAEMAMPLKSFDVITIGFPGYVKRGLVLTAPNLGSEDWAGFPLERSLSKLLGKPARLLNDADVQGLGAIKGKGLELVVTLGTGFGTAWFQDGALLPHLEFSHVPVHHKQDFDAYIGEAARRKLGQRQWIKRVKKTLEILRVVFNYDHLYVGGGNANRLDFKLPPHVSHIPNDDGIAGAGFAWNSRNMLPAPAPGAQAQKARKKVSAARKRPGKSSRR